VPTVAPGTVDSIDPSDFVVSRTIANNDRNVNQSVHDVNANSMIVHKQVFATRGKNSLQGESWETWTKLSTTPTISPSW
jgi:hypothetical protein